MRTLSIIDGVKESTIFMVRIMTLILLKIKQLHLSRVWYC